MANEFRNLTLYELNELAKKIEKEKSRRLNPRFKKTKTYKKGIVSVKNLNRKIERLIYNTEPDKDIQKTVINQIKIAYGVKKPSQLSGSLLKKAVNKLNVDLNKFEKKWEKHYQKAANAIDFLYKKDQAKYLKHELRTEIYKKAKAEYLIQISNLKLEGPGGQGYERLFDLVMENQYPTKREEFIDELVKSGYSEAEIRRLIDEYDNTGNYNKPTKINYQKVFEKSLRKSVYEVNSTYKTVYLGNKLDTEKFLDNEGFEELIF